MKIRIEQTGTKILSETEPLQQGDLWRDESTDPETYYKYDGEAWVRSSFVTGGEMSNEEKAKEFCARVIQLEKEYGLVLTAYSGTGDLYIMFEDDTEQEFDFTERGEII